MHLRIMLYMYWTPLVIVNVNLQWHLRNSEFRIAFVPCPNELR